MRPLLVSRQYGLWVAAAVCAVFLFLGGPDLIHTRSFKHALDLGHIAAFTLWSLLLMHQWPGLASVPFRQQAATVLLFCVVAGAAVEIIQSVIGRHASLEDMGRNAIGGLLALCFFFPGRLSMDKHRLRLFQSITLLLFLIALVPLTRSLIDEWRAWQQFPVLADFETPLELDRWSGNAELTIDRSIARSGRASLKLALTTAEYSGAEIEYFPTNWRNYRSIAFNIYNPHTIPLQIVCKIRDRHHDISGYRFNDRFNRSYLVPYGWNRIEIAMADVEMAPLERKMDLNRITGFQIFTVSLPEPRTLYLDHLRLEP